MTPLATIAAQTVLLCLLSPFVSAHQEDSANDYRLVFAHSEDAYAVEAENAPLLSVVQKLQEVATVPIRGSVGNKDRVTVTFADATLPEAIKLLTDRYVFSFEDGALTGVFLFAEGEEAVAAEQIQSPGELASLAGNAWLDGNLRASMAFYQAAIKADPTLWNARSEYGRLLLLMADNRGAQTHLLEAASLNPDSPQVWLDLMSYYHRTVQREKAASARKKVEQLAANKAIEQDRSGLWRLQGGSIYPSRYSGET